MRWRNIFWVVTSKKCYGIGGSRVIGRRIRVWHPSSTWYLYCLRSPRSSPHRSTLVRGVPENGKKRPQGPATVLGTCPTALSVETPRVPSQKPLPVPFVLQEKLERAKPHAVVSQDEVPKRYPTIYFAVLLPPIFERKGILRGERLEVSVVPLPG